MPLTLRQNCGEDRWKEIPLAVVSKFKDLLHKEQIFRKNNVDSAYQQHNPSTNNGSAGPSQQASTSAASSSSRSRGNANVPQQLSQGNSRTTGQGSGTSETISEANTPSKGQTALVDPRLVFLTVSNNDHHQLAQIKAQILEDDSFFASLRREYIQKRGMLRMIFSIWRYKGCEFRKVRVALRWIITKT
jgi:hypothetical protein